MLVFVEFEAHLVPTAGRKLAIDVHRGAVKLLNGAGQLQRVLHVGRLRQGFFHGLRLVFAWPDLDDIFRSRRPRGRGARRDFGIELRRRLLLEHRAADKAGR